MGPETEPEVEPETAIMAMVPGTTQVTMPAERLTLLRTVETTEVEAVVTAMPATVGRLGLSPETHRMPVALVIPTMWPLAMLRTRRTDKPP